MNKSWSKDKKPLSIYSKLTEGGVLMKKTLFSQDDYDQVLKYIKNSFPKATTLQKDVEKTLKRTFVLGSTETKLKSFRSSSAISPESVTISRQARLKRERRVPRKISYQMFEHMNSLWQDYIADLLQDARGPEDMQAKLCRIDLHGAIAETVQSLCKDYVGLKGIIIKETKNTLVLVTTSNASKTIPKANSTFEIHLTKPVAGVVRIAGNSFITRPAERSSKKIKSFMEFVGVRKYKNYLRYGSR